MREVLLGVRLTLLDELHYYKIITLLISKLDRYISIDSMGGPSI